MASFRCDAEVHRWVERRVDDANFRPTGFAKLADGRLLIYGEKDSYAFDGKTTVALGLGTRTGPVLSAVVDSNGTVYLAGLNGIFRWNGGVVEPCFSGAVLALVRVGKLWIASLPSAAKGVQIYRVAPDSRGCSFHTVSTPIASGIESNPEPSSDGAAYFSKTPFVCKVYEAEEEARYICNHQNYGAAGSLPLEHVQVTRDGSLWARTHGMLIHWNRREQPTVHIIQSAGEVSNFTERIADEICGAFGNVIVCWDGRSERRYATPTLIEGRRAVVFAAADGVVWIAIGGYGILGLSIHPEVSETALENGLEGGAVETLPLPDGSMLATTTDGLKQLKPGERTWRRWGGEAGRGRVLRMRYFEDRVAVNFPAIGLRYFTPQGKLIGTVDRFDPPEGLNTRSLERGASGEILLGGRAGLFVSRGPSEVAKRVPLPQEGVVKDIRRLADGTYAIAYTGGLALGKPGAWRQIDHRDGLRGAALQTAFGDVPPGLKAAEYWVGYDSAVGFARLRFLDGVAQVTNFGAAEGFRDLGIFDFQRGANGTLWRGGGAGIYLSNGKDFQPDDWYTWDLRNGLSNPDVVMNSMRVDDSGEMSVSTVGGIVRIRPSVDLFVHKQQVRTFVSRVWVNGNPPRHDTVVRPPNAGARLEVQLAQLNLMAEPQLSYEYRLNPAISEWRQIGNDRVLIEALPAGRQRLEVRAHPTRFIEPLNVAVLEIDSPLSSTAIWARAALVIAGGGAVVLLWQRRWTIAAWTPNSLWRRRSEKRIFLDSRALDRTSRAKQLRWLPRELQERVLAMLARHDLQIASESPSGDGPPPFLDGRYVLEHAIAKGGSATVYFARDLESKLEVAVKLFHRKLPDGTWEARKLREEIDALRRVEHPGIVRLLDAGESDNGTPYLVMEYIAGTTLRQELRLGRMDEGRAVSRLREILDALQTVHQHGVLHRDLKPENIMLRNPHTPHEHAVLIDFGVAYVHDAMRQTGDSTYDAWTPGYGAPEQTAGIRSTAGDVYAVAMIAFEMLTGKRFRQAVEPGGGQAAILPALAAAGLERAAEWAAVLASASALEYSKRTQTALEFIELLDRFYRPVR